MTLFEAMDTWKFVAGLGVFLLSMVLVEESLKDLADRKLKILFRNYTKTPIRGVLSGTVATAIVQSSSVVTLMVISFVGAGIIKLPNALGVIFGSNLGTTFTGWIVTILGFKMNLSEFSYPLIGVGALLFTLIPKHYKSSQFFRFIAGLGLLLLGLDFMKSSMAEVSSQFDINKLQGYNIFVYFIFGYFFTAAIQSSSATMMITLAAVNAGILNLPQAAALVIGADLGTTTTALLGGLGSSAEKKQTAMAHFVFNLVTDLTALVFLYPILSFATGLFGQDAPLMSLVMFHSSFNLVGIAIFLPFTKNFAKLLEKYFGKETEEQFRYINKVNPQVPEAALEALNKEFLFLIHDVKRNNLRAFGLTSSSVKFEHEYDQLKQKLGDILEYLLDVQKENVTQDVSRGLNQLLKAHDRLARSAKAAKDIHHNVKDLETSSHHKVTELLKQLNEPINEIYQRIAELEKFENQSHIFEEINRIIELNNTDYEKNQQSIYENTTTDYLEDKTALTLLNVNREIHSSNNSFLLALKDILLSPEKSEEI